MNKLGKSIRCAVLGVALLIAQPLASDAEPSASEALVPEAVQHALDAISQELQPYIERSLANGRGGALYGVGWRGNADQWTHSHLERQKNGKTFLIPLRTVIRYAACDGHPKALTSLFHLTNTNGLFFLDSEQRLLLEWRALRAGLTLPFFDPVGKEIGLPSVSLTPSKQALAELKRIRYRIESRAEYYFDSDDPVIWQNHLRLLYLLLYQDRVREALAEMGGSLAKLCLGTSRPRPGKFQYDNIELRNYSGKAPSEDVVVIEPR